MNGPLLFIDTISENVNSSNQEFFDSRIKSKKAKAKYRVEDIEAMLYYRIHVLAEIEKVTREDILNVANSVNINTIYFLKD